MYEFDVVTYRNGCEWAPAAEIDSSRDVDETKCWIGRWKWTVYVTKDEIMYVKRAARTRQVFPSPRFPCRPPKWGS